MVASILECSPTNPWRIFKMVLVDAKVLTDVIVMSVSFGLELLMDKYL